MSAEISVREWCSNKTDVCGVPVEKRPIQYGHILLQSRSNGARNIPAGIKINNNKNMLAQYVPIR